MPRKIRNCKGVINIKKQRFKNVSFELFWHPYTPRINSHRVSNYKSYETDINMGDINYPVQACDSTFQKIERLNNISINVFGFENDSAYPIYMTGIKECRSQVDLLFLKRRRQRSLLLYQKF